MTDAPELPRGLALTWGVAERPERAPRRELSLERIVEAAVEIADGEGLGAVSMARVAQSLGYTTMSLYRYVTSKDDLLLLMMEHVLGTEFPPPHEPADWRAELREWVRFLRTLYLAHDWVLDIPVASAPLTPNNLRIVDAGLRTLRDTPLDDEEKKSVILLGEGYARTSAQLGRDLNRAVEAAGGDDGVIGSAYADALRELVDETRFPYLRPLVEAGSYVGEGELDDVTFGLERLLDGVEVYVAARAAGAPGPGRDGGTGGDGAAALEPEVAESADVAAAYASDPRVKKAATKRKEADRKLREAQKKVRELEKQLRDARKSEAEAARAAREKAEAARDRARAASESQG